MQATYLRFFIKHELSIGVERFILFKRYFIWLKEHYKIA